MYNTEIKKNIYKWRESNREKYNAYVNKKIHERLDDPIVKEKHLKKRMDNYYFKKELEKFRHILIE